MAQESVRKALCVLISTHSAVILETIPLDHIYLVTTPPGGIHVANIRKESDLREAIGVEIPIRIVAFVEDDLADRFFRFLLRHQDFEATREVETSIANGAKGVIAATAAFPTIRGLEVVGVIDGDQSVPNGEDVSILALPGGDAPERMLMQPAVCLSNTFAEHVGASEERVAEIVGALSGLDPHDWLIELTARLGVPEEVVCEGLFRAWVALPENETTATEFVEAFSRLAFGTEGNGH